ncbi:MAG: hypothetical protein EOP48_00715 [Sphingobacteriales bacterium]|nr:MAG: hypothetical protein EOP48_00715 [Sphingobacteriales bacterium]
MFSFFNENLRAQITILTKSQINLWLSTLLQLVYFGVQYLFWNGISRVMGPSLATSDRAILAFLVTLAVVDNIYMCVFARGTLLVQSLIQQNSLEAILLKPISSFRFLLVYNIDLTTLPLALLSISGFIWYHLFVSQNILLLFIHTLALVNGIGILVGISYMYRLTTFWTLGLVSVRYSNPAFKIMVRPWDSFKGNLRIVLLTIFPALFITAIPTAITLGVLKAWFLIYGTIANALVWTAVFSLWNRGLRRYQVKEI